MSKRKPALLCSVGAGLWLFIIYVSPLPVMLIYALEKTYPVIDISQISHTRTTHILVLGGGHTIASRLPSGDQLEITALGRLAEAIRIQKQTPGSKLVLSGYSSSNRITQAEMLARTALDLGVDPSDTIMIITPATTAEEARDYKRRFGDTSQLVLVTSAAHMPRAIRNFQLMGLNPLPAPTNHFIKDQHKVYSFIPSLEKMQLMKKALREYAGLLILRL